MEKQKFYEVRFDETTKKAVITEYVEIPGENKQKFETELDAYKHALNEQNTVVSEFAGDFSTDEEAIVKLTICMTTAASICNKIEILNNKNNESFVPCVDNWINYFTKSADFAFGHAKNPENKISPMTSESQLKAYFGSWLLVFLDKISNKKIKDEYSKKIAELVSDAITKCFEVFIESQIAEDLEASKIDEEKTKVKQGMFDFMNNL